MKILITTDLFVTASNGVVTSVKNLRDELSRKGHDVRILTISGSMSSYRDGCTYYIKSIPFGAVYPDVRVPVSFHSSYIQELIDWRPDVIHSQCEFFSFHFAKRISRITGAPLVHTYHTLYEQYAGYVIPFERLGQYVVKTLSRKRLKCVDTVITPSRKTETALRSYGLLKPIRVIPSGISMQQHKNRLSESERRRKRQELGISDDNQVLISLGRLGVEKNTDELIRLFYEARKHNDKLVFLVVGDGPARDHLESLAVSLGVSDSVIFTGMVEPTAVQKYYQLGDVFVSASTSETQGLTYIEAAANGLPLLCRKDPCLDDVIQEGINGYEYTTACEFLEELNAMLETPGWRESAGRHSEEIASTFDKSSFAVGVEKIYKSVL